MMVEKNPYKGSSWDAFQYFISGFKQLANTPRLVIPSLISSALSSAFIWSILAVLVLCALPIVFEVAPVVEDYANMFDEGLYGGADYPVGVYEELIGGFSPLASTVTTLSIMSLMIILLLSLIFFILSAYVGGGTVGYIWTGVTGKVSFKNFLFYGRSRMWRISGVRILMSFLFLVYSTVFFGVVGLITSTLFSGHQPSSLESGYIAYAILILSLLFLSIILWFLIWSILTLPFLFAETSIVVEDRGVIDSIKRSAKLVSGNIWQIILYVFLVMLIWVVYFLLAVSLNIPLSMFGLGISPLFTLSTLFFMNPWMDLVKLNFFLNIIGRPAKVADVRVGLIKRYMSKSKDFISNSPNILINFVRCNVGYITLSTLFAVVGFYIGYLITNQFTFLSEYIDPIITEAWGKGFLGTPYSSLPFIDVFYYLFHNTQIVIVLSLSGMFYVIPPLLGISATAGTVGMVYGILPFNLATAGVLAHGVPEIAALLIATAAGLRFGVHVLRKDPDIDGVLDDTLKTAFASLILIAVAAFIEAFITPIFMYMVV